MADMWQSHLGIEIEIQAIQSFPEYNDRLLSNPPDLFWSGWAADYNDPDNFLKATFVFRLGIQLWEFLKY